MNKNGVIAGFGEVMLRLAAPGRKRMRQALPGELIGTFGGGEANVCAALASMGEKSCYLTVLPDNPVTDCFIAQMKSLDVDTSRIIRTKNGRMGIYYVEHGAAQRGSGVWYDRDHSAIAELAPENYDFAAMLCGVRHLHLTGITPALSSNAYLATLQMAKTASEMGCTISCDLNFRKKLWNWEPGTAKSDLARRCMTEIIQYADWIIGNEADAADVFGIEPENSDFERGELNTDAYKSVAERLSEKFPKAILIAFTLRGSLSADFNYWGGMIYDCRQKEVFMAPLNHDGKYEPYAIMDIVDRFGGGDSFCAGLIYALYSDKYSAPADAIKYAVAASCLKHSIEGDYNLVSESEVINLMKGNASGRVVR